MVDAVTIGGALSSLKTASDIAKTLIGLRDESQIRNKVTDLQSALISAQQATLEAQAEQSRLIQRERDLQAEVARLNGELTAKRHAPAIQKGRECPKCGGDMDLTEERPDPTFGIMGGKEHALECQRCHFKVTRAFQPGTGYC